MVETHLIVSEPHSDVTKYACNVRKGKVSMGTRNQEDVTCDTCRKVIDNAGK